MVAVQQLDLGWQNVQVHFKSSYTKEIFEDLEDCSLLRHLLVSRISFLISC